MNEHMVLVVLLSVWFGGACGTAPLFYDLCRRYRYDSPIARAVVVMFMAAMWPITFSVNAVLVLRGVP